MLIVTIIAEAWGNAAAVHETKAYTIGAHHREERANHHGQLINERSLLEGVGEIILLIKVLVQYDTQHDQNEDRSYFLQGRLNGARDVLVVSFRAHIVLEILKLVPWSRNRSTAEVHVGPIVHKARYSICNREFLLSFLQVDLLKTLLLDPDPITDGTDERGHPTKIKHQVHGDVLAIDAWVINLLMELGECQNGSTRRENSHMLILGGQQYHHQIRE